MSIFDAKNPVMEYKKRVEHAQKCNFLQTDDKKLKEELNDCPICKEEHDND